MEALNCSNYSKSIIDILKAFKKIGWDIYNLEGKVEYLPVGDNDKYGWQWEKCLKLSFTTLFLLKLLIRNK